MVHQFLTIKIEKPCNDSEGCLGRGTREVLDNGNSIVKVLGE